MVRLKAQMRKKKIGHFLQDARLTKGDGGKSSDGENGRLAKVAGLFRSGASARERLPN